MIHPLRPLAALILLSLPASAQDAITLGMVLEPPNLDPTGGAAAATDEVVYANVFEGLTRFGPNGSIEPALAERWDVEQDGRVYVFHLQDGVTFHDGSPLDAQVVANNLDAYRGAYEGRSPALFVFVFLVALGIDYNIFLMTRVREETMARGTRSGSLVALSATGGVITSAGVVLAATFTALGVIPILFLAQIAFIVAFGVLLDALVVRSLLVPALCHWIGPRIWWPSGLARRP